MSHKVESIIAIDDMPNWGPFTHLFFFVALAHVVWHTCHGREIQQKWAYIVL